MKLSIVIPVYNEEKNIENLISKIDAAIKVPFELVVVNDHSTDKTSEILKKLSARMPSRLKVVDNDFARGFANALKYGFKHASGDAVVPIMGDLCDDLSSVDNMFAKILQGYDVVCGSRYIKGGARRGGSLLKGTLSRWAGITLHYLINFPTSDITNAYKMYRKNVVEGMDFYSQGFEISMEIPIKAYYCGFKITEVPTVWKERTQGKSSFKIFKLLPSYLRLYLWAILKRMQPTARRGHAAARPARFTGDARQTDRRETFSTRIRKK